MQSEFNNSPVVTFHNLSPLTCCLTFFTVRVIMWSRNDSFRRLEGVRQRKWCRRLAMSGVTSCTCSIEIYIELFANYKNVFQFAILTECGFQPVGGVQYQKMTSPSCQATIVSYKWSIPCTIYFKRLLWLMSMFSMSSNGGMLISTANASQTGNVSPIWILDPSFYICDLLEFFVYLLRFRSYLMFSIWLKVPKGAIGAFGNFWLIIVIW